MVRYILLILFVGLPFAQDITIAVLDFDGNGVSQSETRTLTNRLRDELFKTGVYIVLERGKMDDVLKEQGFQQTGCVTSECAVEVGNMLGVQQMVGFRHMREKSFYYVELRPTFHNFQYESGLGRLREHDQFVLQSFQVQLGVGKNIF